jgi:hypothetical protein
MIICSEGRAPRSCSGAVKEAWLKDGVGDPSVQYGPSRRNRAVGLLRIFLENVSEDFGCEIMAGCIVK